MAKYTYYYFFSIFMALLSIFYMYHVVYYKLKNKTFLGQKFKAGTPQYLKLKRLTKNLNILIAAIMTVIFLANLVYAVVRLIALNTADAHFVLIFAPIFLIILCVGIIFTTRNTLRGMINK